MPDSIALKSQPGLAPSAIKHSGGGMVQPDAQPQAQTLWTSAAALQARLEVYFRHVEKTRMDGVFLLNPALQVQAIGFEQNAEATWWQGILIAPWFMNILRFPVHTQVSVLGRGKKAMAQVWGERFAFIGAYEAGLGPYEMCSLFSSMFEFSDQLGAQAVAQTILQDLKEQEQNQSLEQTQAQVRGQGQGQSSEPNIAGRGGRVLSEEDAKVASRRRFLFGRGAAPTSPSSSASAMEAGSKS